MQPVKGAVQCRSGGEARDAKLGGGNHRLQVAGYRV